MASATRNDDSLGVEFTYEEDGRVTAKHLKTGVASYGSSEAEALRMLADAMESHEAAEEYPDNEVPSSDAPWL